MGIAPLRGFAQLVDDVLRGRLIGIAHAEIDDVLATVAGRHLEIVHLAENVGRQAVDAGKSGTHERVLPGETGLSDGPAGGSTGSRCYSAGAASNFTDQSP